MKKKKNLGRLNKNLHPLTTFNKKCLRYLQGVIWTFRMKTCSCNCCALHHEHRLPSFDSPIETAQAYFEGGNAIARVMDMLNHPISSPRRVNYNDDKSGSENSQIARIEVYKVPFPNKNALCNEQGVLGVFLFQAFPRITITDAQLSDEVHTVLPTTQFLQVLT